MIHAARRQLLDQRSLSPLGDLHESADHERAFFVLGQERLRPFKIGLFSEVDQELGFLDASALENPWVHLVPPTVVGNGDARRCGDGEEKNEKGDATLWHGSSDPGEDTIGGVQVL